MDINLTEKLKKKMGSRSRVRGRYNSSELYFILNGDVTPEMWMNPQDKTMKDIMNMWNGIGVHNQLEDLLGKEHSEAKVEYKFRDIVLVGKADYLPPNKIGEVWEFKTSERKMKEAKPWHLHQTGLYATMFEKERGLVYQPVSNADGLYLKHIGTVERDDRWFQDQLERLYDFHIDVERLWNGSDLPF